MIPETWLPTWTVVTAEIAPVAVTVMVTSPRSTSWTRYLSSPDFPPLRKLDDPEWWFDQKFVAQRALPEGAAPSPLFEDGQVELSVHYEPARQRFVELQMQGLFVNDERTQLAMRVAPRPEGPWSALEPFCRPAESSAANVADLAAYAGKAHPEQRGADLVLTYVVNDLKRFPPKDALYYPQVLRLDYRDAGSE